MSTIRRRAVVTYRAAVEKSLRRRALGWATRQVPVRASCWVQAVRSMASRTTWIQMALEAAPE